MVRLKEVATLVAEAEGWAFPVGGTGKPVGGTGKFCTACFAHSVSGKTVLQS